MGNLRHKGTHEYIQQQINLDTGYQELSLYCDDTHSYIYRVHVPMKKVFNLYYEEYPMKGISNDPRRHQDPTALLYSTGPPYSPNDTSLVVYHIDEVKANNSVQNLRLCTQKMNMVASCGTPCALLNPVTYERKDCPALSYAVKAVGYDLKIRGRRAMFLRDKLDSKGILWKGKVSQKL
jgi:hypothetical protein